MADMNTVRIVSKSTVRPASGDHGGRIELTPFDLIPLLHSYTQRGLLFHKPASTTVGFVERLKAALSRALDVFLPLAGRLEAIEDSDGEVGTASFFIQCNGEGTLFVHATAEGVAATDVLAEPVAVPEEIFSSFFLMNRVLNCEEAVSELPLLAVQVTELSDGIFVAYALNHVVADGTGLWHFLNVWSEISRCGNNEVLPQQYSFRRPVFGREFLDGLVDLPLRIPFSRDRIHRGIFPTRTLQSRSFRFSKEKIAELKAKANANAAKTGTSNISSLQALMANLWVCVTRSRHLDPLAEVTKVVVVGMRPRLEPPLPKEYFGNAIRSAAVKTTAGELLERGMGWAARQMNSAIAAQTPSEARKYLQDWVKEIRQQPSDMPASSLLATGSSPRFDVFGNDFGYGRPLALRVGPAGQFDGRVLTFPGTEEGSIDLEVCLMPEALCALDNDAEFVNTLN